MEKLADNNRIVTAGFGKRTVAFLIDIGIVFIASMILWNTVGSGPLMEAFGNKEIISELYDYAEETKLFEVKKDEDGNPTAMQVYSFVAGSSDSDGHDQGGYGYQLYLEHCYDSYTTFFATSPLADAEITVDEKTYTQAEFYTGARFAVDYLELPEEYPVTANPAEDEIDDESHYFRYALNEEGYVDPNAMPVLTSSAQAIIDGTNNNDKVEILGNLRSFFINSDSSSGIYVDLCNLALGQTYYASRYSGWLFNSWATLAIFYLPLAFIWFFVIPLCFPDGQTLGKKIMGLALVMKDGYALRWDGHLLHPFLIFLIVASACAIPFNILNQYISILMFFVLAVLDYMVAFLSKSRNMTLTDKISGTMVIDAKSSIWFANKETEEEYEKSHSTLRPKSSFFSEQEKAEQVRVAMEDSILDLSTIDRHRKEAAAITSFDEFEKNGVDISNVDLKKDEGEKKE